MTPQQNLTTACAEHGYRIIDMGDHLRIAAINVDEDGSHRAEIAKANGFEHNGHGGGYTFLCPHTQQEKEETWIEVEAATK